MGALITTCLLEERAGDDAFSYTAPDGVAYALKWTFHNEAGLVFVAVYQRALALSYVDNLLANVKKVFTERYYQPQARGARSLTCILRSRCSHRPVLLAQRRDYASFTDNFCSLVAAAESKAAEEKRQRSAQGGSSARAKSVAAAQVEFATPQVTAAPPPPLGIDQSADGATPADAAFDLSRLSISRKPGASPALPSGTASGAKQQQKATPKSGAASGSKKSGGKALRTWDGNGGAGSVEAGQQLDFSDASGIQSTPQQGGPPAVTPMGRSAMDMDDESDDELGVDGLDDDDGLEDAGGDIAPGAKSTTAAGGTKRAGWFSAVLKSSAVTSVLGKSALSREDVAPILEQLKLNLLKKNVASDIADKLCDSVARTLEGRRLASFTSLASTVKTAMEEALTRILTPQRGTDILRDIGVAVEAGRAPYVIVFVGVNGVGKSTNLAKVAYWLTSNGKRVMIAACDTFRSGAVEQLRTHCTRLGVPLFEKGYAKDPAGVAGEAIKAASKAACDVLLVDTAGRMQDNEPLMRALSKLINQNRPDLVLFVGEALVGNDAVDQLSKFNARLADLSSQAGQTRVIDGIVLTKFDTIDDKVGAALSMVYTSGAPIMFVGTGQTYTDLKRFNAKTVVKSLLR